VEKVKYQSQLADMVEKRKIWRYLTIGMAISNLLLAFHLFRLEVKEKTIIIPADLSKEFWVDGDNVSPAYLEEMANMYANWLKSFNPKNVDSQFDKILKYSDPLVYSDMKSWLAVEAERVKDMDITSSIFPLSIRISGFTVDIQAQIISMLGGKVVNDDVHYLRMILKYRNGKLFISGFSEGQIDKAGKFVLRKGSGGFSEYLKNKD
jgi:conjugal transfer pilus assembly protein TraE